MGRLGAGRVLDAGERPVGHEPLTHGAPERGVQFPHTNDENPPPYLREDVANQPADVSFVLDQLLARGLGDAERIGVGGYSLRTATALAAGLHPSTPTRASGRSWPSPVGSSTTPPSPEKHCGRYRSCSSTAPTTKASEALELYEAAQEPKEFPTIEGAGHDIYQETGSRTRHG